MFKRKLMALLLSLTLLLGVSMPAMAAEASVTLDGSLVILHTNDIHGRAMTDPSTNSMGYALLAKFVEDLKAIGADVLLLDAGDFSQGTPLVNLSKGAVAIEFMNAVGYHAAAPGNHEFDWGLDNFQQIAEIAEFPILAANILDRTSREPLFQEHFIFETDGGLSIGIFGLNTPETMTKTHPDKVHGMDILQGEELYACAQAQVDALQEEGVDLVVCLGHLGVDNESEPNRSIDVIANVEGIDLFIDGHSHTEFAGGELHGETLLVSSGQYFNNIGFVTFDGSDLSANLYNNSNAEVATIVNDVNTAVQEELSAVFATTEVDLNGERDPGVRTEETNLGDFACDALLWAGKQAMGDDVVAAVTNGGGIRASIAAGEITMNDMKTVFPFGNEVTVLTVTGAELLEALEAATCSTPEAIGAFPQVAGIEFTIDTTVAWEDGEQYPDSTYFAPKNPGARVTIATVGGEPFDLEAEYRIATNDFTAAGGDTYYAFRYANATTGYNTGVAMEDALVQYVAEELGGVVPADTYGEPQGRITVIK